MFYEAHYLNGDIVQIEIEYDWESNEIVEFRENVDYQPEYAIMIDDYGSTHPAMSWREFKEKGAMSSSFGTFDEFEEWLIAVAPEYQGCITPVALFKERIAPYL
jgi:hypothetical protein